MLWSARGPWRAGRGRGDTNLFWLWWGTSHASGRTGGRTARGVRAPHRRRCVWTWCMCVRVRLCVRCARPRWGDRARFSGWARRLSAVEARTAPSAGHVDSQYFCAYDAPRDARRRARQHAHRRAQVAAQHPAHAAAAAWWCSCTRTETSRQRPRRSCSSARRRSSSETADMSTTWLLQHELHVCDLQQLLQQQHALHALQLRSTQPGSMHTAGQHAHSQPAQHSAAGGAGRG